MRVGIFYFSMQSRFDRTPVLSDGGLRCLGFVRCDEVEAEDVGAALDMAQPNSDESVMNTHELIAEFAGTHAGH